MSEQEVIELVQRALEKADSAEKLAKATNDRLNEENMKLATALAGFPALEEKVEGFASAINALPTQEAQWKAMEEHWAAKWNSLVLGQTPQLFNFIWNRVLAHLVDLNLIESHKAEALKEADDTTHM